ncbi:fumarate reductase subunit D [Phytoactinopolyspora endophytica]|uniref:fumarate reductase subunit D n=1 Tax=Phytoactinopolyspora endophytica TaxID=1642495 RepID=UPI00101D282F|nr:fumarate reductase subunit D [Phytoactinopolyspora endophytica]
MPNREVEPFAWMAFSAGGVAAAMFAPILLFLFGLALPLGWVSPDHAGLLDALGHPLTRLALLGVCAAALFHFAHRFRYTLYDGLQLARFGTVITAGCYGLAVLGSAAAAYILLLVL